jgi:hypothetical protein
VCDKNFWPVEEFDVHRDQQQEIDAEETCQFIGIQRRHDWNADVGSDDESDRPRPRGKGAEPPHQRPHHGTTSEPSRYGAGKHGIWPGLGELGQDRYRSDKDCARAHHKLRCAEQTTTFQIVDLPPVVDRSVPPVVNYRLDCPQ